MLVGFGFFKSFRRRDCYLKMFHMHCIYFNKRKYWEMQLWKTFKNGFPCESAALFKMCQRKNLKKCVKEGGKIMTIFYVKGCSLWSGSIVGNNWLSITFELNWCQLIIWSRKAWDKGTSIENSISPSPAYLQNMLRHFNLT